MNATGTPATFRVPTVPETRLRMLDATRVHSRQGCLVDSAGAEESLPTPFLNQEPIHVPPLGSREPQYLARRYAGHVSILRGWGARHTRRHRAAGTASLAEHAVGPEVA